MFIFSVRIFIILIFCLPIVLKNLNATQSKVHDFSKEAPRLFEHNNSYSAEVLNKKHKYIDKETINILIERGLKLLKEFCECSKKEKHKTIKPDTIIKMIFDEENVEKKLKDEEIEIRINFDQEFYEKVKSLIGVENVKKEPKEEKQQKYMMDIVAVFWALYYLHETKHQNFYERGGFLNK